MPHAPEHLDILASLATEAEAAMLVALLEGEGIDAAMEGVYTSGFRAEAPGDVRVLVRPADRDAAETILAEYREGRLNVDWSKEDIGDDGDRD